MRTDTDQLSPEAISRRNLLELSMHGAWFIAINLMLVLINLTFTPSYLWFFWPLIGWGLGFTGHAVQTLWIETLPPEERYLVTPDQHQRRKRCCAA